MGVGDFSFGALSRDAIVFMWPSMVMVTAIYGFWARHRRFIRPSRTVLTVSWLAAAGSAATLVVLSRMTIGAYAGEDWASDLNWYMFVEMPLPASLTYAGLQLVALLRPRGGWFTAATVGVSALAAGLVSAIWFFTAPILVPPVDQIPLWIITLILAAVCPVIGYALALPLWLTALRRNMGSDPRT